MDPRTMRTTLNTMRDLVFVPSIDVSDEYTRQVAGVEVYEQRLLCVLLRLRDPLQRVIYVTSNAVSAATVDYMLSLLGTVMAKNARTRLVMLSCDSDPSHRSLAAKLLDSPEMIATIRSHLVSPPSTAEFACYMHTELEERIASALGILSFKKQSEHCDFWGSKLGSRQCFAATNIPHPRGSHTNLTSINDLIKEVRTFTKQYPEVRRLMVKLNEGVSGLGNAVLALDMLHTAHPPLSVATDKQIHERIIDELQPCSGETSVMFLNKFSWNGAIVEEMYEHKGMGSPSVQGLIDSDNGTVRILSTHEQILDHQVYQGCSFPAPRVFRTAMIEYGKRVGAYLSRQGAKGHFGVDFCDWFGEEKIKGSDTTGQGRVVLSAIEINLRCLGTTHPLMILELLTGGSMREDDGSFVDVKGRERCYVASDCYKHKSLMGWTAEEFVKLVRSRPAQLAFNKTSGQGPVFYMLDSLSAHGKLGMMYISDSSNNARNGFIDTQELIVKLASVGSSRY